MSYAESVCQSLTEKMTRFLMQWTRVKTNMSAKSARNKSECCCSSNWFLKEFPFICAIFFLALLNIIYLFFFASYYIEHCHYSIFIVSQIIYIVQFALHLNIHYSDPGKSFPKSEEVLEGK